MKYDRNYPSHVREISSKASIFSNTKENSTEILISAMRRPWEFLFHPSSTLNTSFTLHCRKLVETSISRENKAYLCYYFAEFCQKIRLVANMKDIVFLILYFWKLSLNTKRNKCAEYSGDHACFSSGYRPRMVPLTGELPIGGKFGELRHQKY